MIHFCTIFDKNYAHKGITLIRSIKQHCKQPHKIYVLCLDMPSFQMMVKMAMPDIYLMGIELLELCDPELRAAKNLPISNYGTPEANYIWRLTPYFINYVLNHMGRNAGMKAGEKLMYVDSDIYFYDTPEKIFDVVGDKSMGIHTHRFGGPFQSTRDVGWFNVGVVVFTNDVKGRMLSDMWKGFVIKHDHELYSEYGTCGDQKYLDYFYQNFQGMISVFDEEGSVHHAAPWCAPAGPALDFYHFSHFRVTGDWNKPDQMGWADSNNGEWHPTSNEVVKQIYKNYFQQLKKTHEHLSEAGYYWIH
jgi:hypothetical protein